MARKKKLEDKQFKAFWGHNIIIKDAGVEMTDELYAVEMLTRLYWTTPDSGFTPQDGFEDAHAAHMLAS